MFSGFSLDFLKKKLTGTSTTTAASSAQAVRTVDLELKSAAEPAASLSAAQRNRVARIAEMRGKGGSTTAPALSAELIAQRAREIWQRQGCPEGRDFENWLAAEKELREECSR